MECEICNREAQLVEAIGSEKVIRVCEKCAFDNDLPVIKRPSVEQLKKISRYLGVGERVASQNGVDLKKHNNKEIDRELEKMVEANFSEREYPELVDNFHWVVQHARRLKKISQKQLAESIAEPEVIIAMAEKSKLPDNFEKVIGKLEQFLGVKLFKKEGVVQKTDLELNKVDWSKTKMGDLKEIHEEQFSDEEKIKKQAILNDVAKKLQEKKVKKNFWSSSDGEEDLF
ncbi:MAG: hypothetical protein U9Q06_01290 [Nanoarchaeota archaeon]|nr:hypothetical protein [Nanoarchaeota archaeon]